MFQPTNSCAKKQSEANSINVESGTLHNHLIKLNLGNLGLLWAAKKWVNTNYKQSNVSTRIILHLFSIFHIFIPKVEYLNFPFF